VTRLEKIPIFDTVLGLVDKWNQTHPVDTSGKTCVMIPSGDRIFNKFCSYQYRKPGEGDWKNCMMFSASEFMQYTPRPVNAKVVQYGIGGLNHRVNTDDFWIPGFIYNLLIQNDMDDEFFVILDPFQKAYGIRREIPITFKYFEKWITWAETYSHVKLDVSPDDPENLYNEDILEYMAFRHASGVMCEMMKFVIKRGTVEEFEKLFTRMSNDVLEYFMRYDWILDETEDYPEKRMVLLRELQNRGMNTPENHRL
jgi:hypothetical protein